MLPACEHYGVGMIPWSPLGGGLLGGVLADRAAGGRRGNAGLQARVESQRSAAGALGEALRRARAPAGRRRARRGCSTSPIVTAPIIGPRTLDQLDTAMGALEVQLDAEVLAQLDDIFPGPGGPAPEAYAW